MYGNDGASPLNKQGPLKKFPLRNLKFFNVVCFSKSGNGTHLFSGAVFKKCTIVVGQKSPPLSLQNDARLLIRKKMTELEVRLDCKQVAV